MEITESNVECVIAFKDVKVGKIFKHIGDFYLKHDELLSKKDDCYNAVHIVTGHNVCFDQKILVIPYRQIKALEVIPYTIRD